MYKLKYSEEAENDLTDIFNYIANDSRDRAIKYLGEIEKSILQLESFPEIGHVAGYPELASLGIRILGHDDYLIFYIINKEEQEVRIHRVLRGSMNYVHLFKK